MLNKILRQIGLVTESLDVASVAKTLKSLHKITDDRKMLSTLRDIQHKINTSTTNKAKAVKVSKRLDELAETILSGDDSETIVKDIEKELKTL